MKIKGLMTIKWMDGWIGIDGDAEICKRLEE